MSLDSKKISVSFGTSGLRGLVREMTDFVCYSYVTAFLQYVQRLEAEHVASHVDGISYFGNYLSERKVAVSGDLRQSTTRMIRVVYRAIFDQGFTPIDCGRFPTPAVAFFATEKRIPGLMITGSHIPDDRNGIKFFLPTGEITKKDEAALRDLIAKEQITVPDGMFLENGELHNLLFPRWVETDRGELAQTYYMRYVDSMPKNLLEGMRIGIYEHSAVGRELLGDLYESLGAEVLRLGRTDDFVAIDTEALPEDVFAKTSDWANACNLDAVLSTDADSDRPLLFDENGDWLRGDLIAMLTAWFLGAETVVTTLTASSALERSGLFTKTIRTKVGSAYVMEAMQNALANGELNLAGFEPNGGFLVGSPFSMEMQLKKLNLAPPKKMFLEPLMSRDPAIVHIAVLAGAKMLGRPVSELRKLFPPCHVESDRLTNYPIERSAALLAELQKNEGGRYPLMERWFAELGTPINVNLLDGVRMTFAHGETVHVRASGNAPELRCYVETDSEECSKQLLASTLEKISSDH
ncbi:MAG: hypothetical protein FWC50_09275 [Planctomycetaceae bacterium]|nr:hypothetical protein [Planctomycetaceae bacterium]